jgi:two-component sensor histidine kinase/ActR/RegA family two-component response regulator
MGEDEPLTLEHALEFVHADHRSQVREHMLAGGEQGDHPQELEFKIVRPDGETRWLLDRGQVVRVTNGARTGWRLMGTILDITGRKLTEERQKLLMEELDHRVKNILGNVNAIARLSSQRATSVRDFVRTLEGRIHAMSRAHGLLRQSGWGGTDLRSLVTESLAPFSPFGESNVTIEGETVLIRPELTQSLTLILHELATNAVKHGALSVSNGRISVSWSKPGPRPGNHRLVWRESGGPRVRRPEANGFGLSVLQTAAREVGAIPDVQFFEEGFAYSLEGPFEAVPATSGDLAQAAAAKSTTESDSGNPVSRVLVVEDEGLVALQLQLDLESWGYCVVGPGRNLDEGAALARTEEIDAALVDVRLGNQTSAAIADILLERRIPFVFATGYADSAILPQHLRNVTKVSKPYTTDVIKQTVERLVGERRRTV